MKLIARRRPFRVVDHRPRTNALMAHIVDGDERPICGNTQINAARWAEVPADIVTGRKVSMSTSQLNVRLPDITIDEINELSNEYGSQAKVIIAAVSKLKKEFEMTTKIGNLTLAKDIKPTSLVEVRIKTLANHTKDWSQIDPSHTVEFSNLENTLGFVGQQGGVIKHAWNLLGDNTFYTGNGPAGQ